MSKRVGLCMLKRILPLSLVLSGLSQSVMALDILDISTISDVNEPFKAELLVQLEKNENIDDLEVGATTFLPAKNELISPFIEGIVYKTKLLANRQVLITLNQHQALPQVTQQFLFTVKNATQAVAVPITLAGIEDLNASAYQRKVATASTMRVNQPVNANLPTVEEAESFGNSLNQVTLEATELSVSVPKAKRTPLSYYLVKKNDNLWIIAGKIGFKPTPLTRIKTMSQIYGLNPHAFKGGNPHAMEAGDRLKLNGALSDSAFKKAHRIILHSFN